MSIRTSTRPDFLDSRQKHAGMTVCDFRGEDVEGLLQEILE